MTTSESSSPLPSALRPGVPPLRSPWQVGSINRGIYPREGEADHLRIAARAKFMRHPP